MANTPINKFDLNNLKAVEQLGKDFKDDYRLLTIQINNIINRFHTFILIPTLQPKTDACNVKLDFISTNTDLYMAIKNNSDTLPDDDTLPDGYTDISTFLTDYETYKSYCTDNCKDVYKVEFHPNMYKFFNTDELALIRSMYDNIINFNEAKNKNNADDVTDVFDIAKRLNALLIPLFSNL